MRSVDFAKGSSSFEASVASAAVGGNIEIRLDSLSGQLIGSLGVRNTGAWNSWKTQKTNIKKVKNVHDIFFVFKGGAGHLFNIDCWQFKE